MKVIATKPGTQSNPLTHAAPGILDEWGNLWCKCAKCGLIAICSFAFDFYRKPSDPTGALKCEICAREGWFKK